MIREQIRQLKTDPRTLRKFGLMVGGLLLAVGLLLWWRGRPVWPWLVGPGTGLLALGLAAPQALRWLYVAWMSVAIVLGTIMSTVLLVVFFYLAVAPLGWLARLLGQDFLGVKRDRQAPTYWLPRKSAAPRPPSDYERQF